MATGKQRQSRSLELSNNQENQLHTPPDGAALSVSQSPLSERHIAGLLGFLQKYEVDAIFRQQPFKPQHLDATPSGLWRQSLDARQHLEALNTIHSIVELPDSMSSSVDALRSRGTYCEFYEAIADYRFGLAPIEGLLTPQWFADADYIEELASKAPSSDNLAALFDFAFSEGFIAEPVVTGNQVVFASHRRDLLCSPVPEVRKTTSGEYEIILRAVSRPNYVQVAVLGNRLLLANGVHKVLALYKAGVREVPCVWRPIHDLQEVGLSPQNTTLFLPQTFNSQRPALVIDFLNSGVAAPLLLRAMDQILRVSIGVEIFQSPALR